ncbi:hypothetical protein BDF22DRAFT_703078 [Syncephalis plumigaleata]|nr:hypothetical protein BDF22DRAFT_703078 [Syncephalis plumigaleata]
MISLWRDVRRKERSTLKELSEELVKVGFPRVNLLLLLIEQNDESEMVRSDLTKIKKRLLDKLNKRTSIKVSIVNAYNTVLHDEFDHINNYVVHFVAEQEAGPWNGVFLSTAYRAYKWTLFSLILITLVYTFVRLVMLIAMKVFKFDFLVLSYLATIVYSVCFLTYLCDWHSIFPFAWYHHIYSLLSSIPLDLILWHWTIIGKGLVAHRAVMFFRGIILMDLIPNLVTCMVHGLSHIFKFSNILEKSTLYGNFVIILLLSMTVIDFIIFGGFTIWFGWNAYKLRKHPSVDLFHRSSILHLFLFIVWTTLLFKYYYLLTAIQTAIVSIATDTIYLVRALIFLSVLGLRWPQSQKDSTSRKGFSA